MVIDTNHIHEKMLPIIGEVNNILRKAVTENIEQQWKDKEQNINAIVTKTDKEIDLLLRERLTKIIPQSNFLTEEIDEELSDAEYTWIIDPIDGTPNFAYKTPIFSTSIALWKGTMPLYGLLSFPMFDEIIYAMKGKGTCLNNQKIAFTPKNTPPKMTSLSLGGDKMRKVEALNKLISEISYPSSYHCSTFPLALLATNRYDCCVVIDNAIWDIAAAVVLLQESGVYCEYVTPLFNSNDKRGYRHSLVAGNNKDAVAAIAHTVHQIAAEITT